MKLVLPYFIVRIYLRYSRQYYSLFARSNMVSEFYILFISLNIVYFLFLFFDSILSINTLEELNLYRLGPSCIIIAYYIKSLVGEQYVVMPISIFHWHIEIEVFNLRSFMRVAKSLSSVNVSTILAKYLFMLLCESLFY